MLYRIHRNFLDFFHRLVFQKKHDVSETGSGPVIDISSLEGAQMSRCLVPHLHLRTKTDPVSETSCFLKYRTM
jgi:hypothetical protein